MPELNDTNQVLFLAALKADTLRAAGLHGLQGVTQARQVALEREHARLSDTLGAGHARVKALALRMEDGLTRLRDLSVEITRAETVTPLVSAEEWAIHGHVRSKDFSPAPDLTVSLVDGQGQWLRAFGFACTDARGYFQLSTSIGAAQPPDPTALPRLQAHLRVTDADKKELNRGEEALPVTPGSVHYREIVLKGGARGCVSPEEEATGPDPAHRTTQPSPPRGTRRRRPP